MSAPTEHFAIATMVQRLRGMTGDPEAAHLHEDRTYLAALSAIANGAENPDLIARTALQAATVEYDRWYA